MAVARTTIKIMKKLLILLAVILALGVGYKLLKPSSEQQTPPEKEMKQPVAKAWKGSLKKEYHTDFNRRRLSLTVDDVTFTHANRARVNVIVNISIVSRRKPSWLTSKSFTGVRIITARTYRPRISSARSGGTWNAKLVFRGIPVRAVGSTCTKPMFDPLFLRISNVPGPELMVVLDAPPPPPGHCLGKGYKKPKPKVTISRVKVTGKKVVVFGAVKHANFKRVKVRIRGRVKANARPRVRSNRFKTVFRLKKGKYVVRSGYGKRWTSRTGFRVR